MARSTFVHTLVVVAGCGFSVNTGSDAIPGRSISIVDDALDDFVGTRSEATIASRGAIEPEAFVLNGLYARAYASTFPAGSTYAQAEASVQNPLGQGYRQVPYRYESAGSDHPHGLGVGFGSFTILYTGEVHLPAGEVVIEVEADDRGAVELMLDGATWSSSILDAWDSANPRVTLDVPADGWYPIRAAFEQLGGGSFFTIFVTPPGGTRTPIDGTMARARVTDAHGLLVDAFSVRGMGRSLGTTAVANVDHDFGSSAPPFDLNMPISDFTLRYTGQLRIDERGTYTFSADASTSGTNGGDLWRLWIDGVAIAGPWSAARTATASIDLEPGWHDFGVDFADDDGDARIRARMSGPGIPEGVIDTSRLRPAVATGLTAVFSELQTTTQIKDATSNGPSDTMIDTVVQGRAGAKVVAVDWSLGVSSSRMSDLTGRRFDCTVTGTPIAFSPSPSYMHFPDDTSCVGAELPLAWKYVVTDTVAGGPVGSVYMPIVAVTYRGGEKDPPFAEQAVFTSSVRATPGAIGYGPVELAADARGGSVRLEVRTAADEASIASASWVTVADGEVPGVEPGEVLQYRVTLETGGWELVSVDRVEIVYVVPD